MSGQYLKGFGIFDEIPFFTSLSKKKKCKLEIDVNGNYTFMLTDAGNDDRTYTATGSVPLPSQPLSIEFGQANYSSGKKTYLDNIKIISPN